MKVTVKQHWHMWGEGAEVTELSPPLPSMTDRECRQMALVNTSKLLTVEHPGVSLPHSFGPCTGKDIKYPNPSVIHCRMSVRLTVH